MKAIIIATIAGLVVVGTVMSYFFIRWIKAEKKLAESGKSEIFIKNKKGE